MEQRGRGVRIGALVGAVMAVAACGTTDPAAEDRLPPMRTTIATTTTVPETIPDEEQFYVVQQGDTLGRIAEAFQVPVDAIVEANNLASPDAIQAGQTLRIPSGVRVVTELPDDSVDDADS